MREENIRIIFGLKLRQLRRERNISLAELSKLSGMSSSYLNEIEKGKKKPKAEKIAKLAQVFNVSYDDMVSLQLSKNLAPLGDLLMTNILNDIPLEVFGLNFNHLVDLMRNAPAKVGAFFKTIIEISRNYDLQKEYFYFATLRSFQEINNNYFQEIENTAFNWLDLNELSQNQTIETQFLIKQLLERYNYNIEEFNLKTNPSLNEVRSFYIDGEQPILMLHPKLSNWQKRYILARELGYKALGIESKNRSHMPLLLKAPNFEMVLNNFKASYFAASIIMPETHFVMALKKLFRKKNWDNQAFLQMMEPYGVSPEIFLLRMTNLMQQHFGLKQIFFLRFQSKIGSNKYQLTRELHLGHQHSPHANENYRHYCRRWPSLRLLKSINSGAKNSKPIIDAQISNYLDTGEQYFSIALARPMSPIPGNNVSVSIGWLINEKTKEQMTFLNDTDLQRFDVNNTCESCHLKNCNDRVVEASLLEKSNLKKEIRNTIKGIIEQRQALKFEEA